MSVKHGLLALLAERPMYGNQLRAEFESRTGGAWALNVGQVYTTLDRLVRDRLVATAGSDDDGHDLYELTQTGRETLAAWWASPVTRESRPRDELTIKLAFAVTAPGVDVSAVVQTQRVDTMRALQEYTRLKRDRDTKPDAAATADAAATDAATADAADPDADPDADAGPAATATATPDPAETAWLLVLESMIFQAEAEMRWLEHCEHTLVARSRQHADTDSRRTDGRTSATEEAAHVKRGRR